MSAPTSPVNSLTLDQDVSEEDAEGVPAEAEIRAFKRMITQREPSMRNGTNPRMLVRQKSYFLEDTVSFKDSSLRAGDLSSLDKILHDRVGLATFKNFLKSIFADENLGFWCDVKFFKTATLPEQRQYEAKRIYDKYIHDKSQSPINVSNSTKVYIQSNMEPPGKPIPDNLFDEAQDQTYELMERDCFPRFRKSPYYYKLQEGLDENLISHMVKKKTGLRKMFSNT